MSSMIKITRSGIKCSLCAPKSCLLPNYSQSRFLRKWARAHMYPPNYHKDSHHFFFPPLSQQLKEREATLNPVEIHDIGISGKEFLKRVGKTEGAVGKIEGAVGSVAEQRSKQQRHLSGSGSGSNSDSDTKIEVASPKDLIKLVDVSVQKSRFDYAQYKMAEGLTDPGKEGLKELAHHYHIYRDLFSSPSLQSLDQDVLPKATIPNIAPMSDIPHVEVLQKWFPGSLRRTKVPARSIFHFTPHAPIYAEFAVPEDVIKANEEDGNEETVPQKSKDSKPDGANPGDAKSKDGDQVLITTPVYAGNLIDPLYASVKPSVVIDVRGTSESNEDGAPKSYFDSVELDRIKLLGSSAKKMYTLMLLNLDTIFGDANPVCHWMVSNIGSSAREGQASEASEIMSFLPIYGIRGFGYHRYVFLLYQHDSIITMNPIETLNFNERQLEPHSFMKNLDASAVPVGLSWFQSQWDAYSQKLFHETLNMRAPVYEYIERKESEIKQQKFPPLAPFNIYLDHFRHPKELAEESLVERLKSIDPFNYDKNFDVDPIPNAYGQLRDDKTIPSWMHSKIWKKRNKLGQWRHLRPVSAKAPLNNHPDLDRPIWPNPARVDLPNRYPDIKRRPKPLRLTKWVIPAPQHPTYRIQHEDIHAIHKELDKEE